MQATSADASRSANSLSRQPARAVHDVGDAEFGDQLLGRPVGFQLRDQLNVEVALDPQPGDRVQQVTDALERHVGARDRDDPVAHPVLARPEQLRVDTERHDVQLIGRDAEVLGDVGRRGRRHGQQLRNLARDLLLHLGEAIPPAHQRLSPPLRGGHVEHAVAGDRMVHRRHDGQAEVGDRQQTVAQALVVVHDVEVVDGGRPECAPRAGRTSWARERRPSTWPAVRAGRCGRESRWVAGRGTDRARGRGRGWAPWSGAPAGRDPRDTADRRRPRRRGQGRRDRGSDGGRRRPAHHNASCFGTRAGQFAWLFHRGQSRNLRSGHVSRL